MENGRTGLPRVVSSSMVAHVHKTTISDLCHVVTLFDTKNILTTLHRREDIRMAHWNKNLIRNFNKKLGIRSRISQQPQTKSIHVIWSHSAKEVFSLIWYANSVHKHNIIYPLTPIYLIESNNTNGAHKRIYFQSYYTNVYRYCHVIYNYAHSKFISRVAWERIRYIWNMKDWWFSRKWIFYNNKAATTTTTRNIKRVGFSTESFEIYARN